MSSAASAAVRTPVGRLVLAERDGALVRVSWSDAPADGTPTPLLAEAVRQVEAYFAGRLRAFDLPLAPAGSAHDRGVWAQMRAIPYGETRTYGDLAAALAGIARAVGTACGRNPIPVIIPCHRVTAADGRLGGYSGAGGTRTKLALLELEGALDGPLFRALPHGDKPETAR